MKQIMAEVDEGTLANLEFIRAALRRALWGIEERATAAAYRRRPDSVADAPLDPRAWEPRKPARRRKARR